MSGFDYVTVIGRDPNLFRFHVSNVLENAGLPRNQWDFNVIVYFNRDIPGETTDEIVDICEENDIAYQLTHENPQEPFIVRLYRTWNTCQTMGKRPLTLRAGSDQTWYPGSFERILNAWDEAGEEVILHAQTIESKLAKMSRHMTRDFGTNPATYDHDGFVQFCETIKCEEVYTIDEAIKKWGHPTSFSSSLGTPHNRPDGCSWLQSKELFHKYGPMPAMEGRWTGDVIIHDRYERAGIPSYLVGDCITYHFVKGESAGHGQ